MVAIVARLSSRILNLFFLFYKLHREETPPLKRWCWPTPRCGGLTGRNATLVIVTNIVKMNKVESVG